MGSAKYLVFPDSLVSVVCHKRFAETTSFLVQWKADACGEQALSWHTFDELRCHLPLIQKYISQLSIEQPTITSFQTYSESSAVYKGQLKYKYGWITIESVEAENSQKNDNIPTENMQTNAARTPVTSDVHAAIREAFLKKMSNIPKISLENTIDNDTPPLTTSYVDQYIVHGDVERILSRQLQHKQTGCDCKGSCSSRCTCQEKAFIDEEWLNQHPAIKLPYMKAVSKEQFVDTSSIPKLIPYVRVRVDKQQLTVLSTHYQEDKVAIYECNEKCRCNRTCRGRLVQHGRQIPLTIFKTRDRGWALRCDERIVQGQFVERYLGEIVTAEEANRRDEQSTDQDVSYSFLLDFFKQEHDTKPLVVYAEHAGNISRFLNHSCDPNLGVYAVSYDKQNTLVYDLAFFTLKDINPGTELTFDYTTRKLDESFEEQSHEEAGKDMTRCRCGTSKCRRLLWL